MISKRDSGIDIAKGICIFLVILGHIVVSDSFAFNWIFSFHVPAFFFLSGMTLKPERYQKFSDFLRARVRLLIIYLAVVAGAFLICMLRPLYRAPVLADGLYTQLKWIFWYAQPQNLYVGQTWFLVCLFFAELYVWLWVKVFGKRPPVIRVLSLIVLAFVGLHIRAIFPFIPVGNRLPWKLDAALAASVFVICGYYASQMRLVEKVFKMRWFLIPLTLILSLYLSNWRGVHVNLCDCNYGPGLLYFAAAFAGIAALVLISYVGSARLSSAGGSSLLSSFSRDFWEFWRFCGRYSMALLVAQTFVIYLWVEVIARITGIIIAPTGYVPNFWWSLAMAVASLFSMLLFIYPWDLIRRRRRSGLIRPLK